MPSIGDITGRIVIQDTGSATISQFSTKIDQASKTIIASMSKATLATETSIRQINASLAKLKTKVEPTESAKGLVSDLDALIKKRQQEIAAVKAGPAAVEALNRKRYEEAQALRIAAAQVDAGVSAESHLGRVIASNIKTLDRYEKELDDVARAQAKAAQKTEQQIAAYRKLSDTGSMLTARVTLPLAGLAAVSFKTSTDLNKSLANVSALLTDFAGEDLNTAINDVKINIQSLAPELGKSTTDLSEGLYEVVSSLGFTNDSLGQLEIAARAGAAGLATTRESINFLTAVTKTYGDTSETAFKKVADLGFQAVNIGQTTFPQLAASIGGVAPIAQEAGVSLEEMFAVIATATGVTGNTSEVTNQMAAAITALLSPSESLKLMYKELGVNSGEAMIAQFGLVGSLQKVAQFSQAAGIPLVKLLGRKEAFIITASLAGAQANTFATNLDRMGKAAKANGAIVADAFEKQTQGINKAGFQYDQAKAKLEVLSQRLGDQLAPSIVKVLEKITILVERFGELPPSAQKIIIVIGTLAAATGPAVFVTGQLLLAWRQIVIFTPKLIAALNSTSAAMAGVRLGIAGIIGAGIYAFLDGLINKWREASQAVIDYNVEVGNVEGSALAFVQKVAQGPLYGIVSEQEFANRIKQAEVLREAILKANTELEKMRKPAAGKDNVGTRDLADSDFFNPDRARTLKQELNNLWTTYGKLRTTLAGVSIAGKEVDETFDENPFGNMNLNSKEAEKALLGVRQAIEDLRQSAIQAEKKSATIALGTKAFKDLEITIEAQNIARDLNNTLVEHGLFLTREQISLISEYVKRETKANDVLEQRTRKLETLIQQTSNIALNQFAKNFELAGKKAAGEVLKVEIQVAKLLNALNIKRGLDLDTDFQIKLNLVTETDARMRAIEIEYLHFVRQLGDGSLKEGERVFAEMGQRFGWTVENIKERLGELLDAERFARFLEEFEQVAEGLANDLVANWRRAWEENESIADATVDTLRDSLLNVLQDIISQWLSQWFRAMAAWLARWIATQRIAQASTASMSAGSTGAGGGLGSLFGIGSQVAGAQSAGVSANALAGWASAAFALYVVYRGFIEDHKRKFARVEIIDGQSQMTAWHGRKYMAGVQQAAESIIANVAKFLDDINVTIDRLGTVIIESSKAGFNVSMSPTSTGKLFKSMEEAISYAQVLMLKYGEFADSVSLLVQSVIKSSKAITIEDLASDIAFAKELETQNLEDAALSIQRAMDLAIAQWKRAEDLFLGFFDQNLPAFAEAANSIITRLSNSLWAQYNQLAGIEEDPEKAWQRQKAAFNAQRVLVLAQLKLWALEIDARIKNFRANTLWLGGIGEVTRGTIKLVSAMLSTAEAIDPALQQLLDIQKLINEAINQTPPELTDADFPGRQGRRGGGRDRKQLRDDLRDEIATLEAEAKGPLHSAFYELNRNIEAFVERAREAKLPAEELARGIELLTKQFQAGIRAQAEGFAGLGTDFTRKLREINDFFDQLRDLGRKQTGMPNWMVELLEGKALDQLGVELDIALDQFSGLIDPMLAINAQADTLRQNVIAYGQAMGWTAEQIDEALNQIEGGIEFQRQQGINSLLDRLFAYAREAGLYQQEAIELEREKALLDLQIIEAQLQFYGALNQATQDMIDNIRGFINSDRFNRDQRSNEVISVRVVEDEADIFTELFENIKSAVEDWRAAIEDFAESTQELLTDEELSGLTQQEQLDFARARVEDLIARAQAGDIEALSQLAAARSEFLEELRESEGAGFGFDEGWEWVMRETAELLANAQQGEQNLIADMLEGWEVPIHRMPDLLEDLNTTMYEGIAQIVDAIFVAIGGVPGMATGGIVMSGPRLVRVAEYVPEAIVPLNKLASAIPYSGMVAGGIGNGGYAYGSGYGYGNGNGSSNNNQSRYRFDQFDVRNSMSRLSNLESANRSMSDALRSIRDDIGAIRRRST